MKYLVFNIFDLSIIFSFLLISFFTSIISLLKSTGVLSNFPVSNLSTLTFKMLKALINWFNSSTSILSALDSKLTKLIFLANFDLSTSVRFLKSAYVA